MVKNLQANAGDSRELGSIPVLGRSPGAGNGNWINYSCLENFMDQGAWRACPWGCKELDITEHTHTQNNRNDINCYNISREQIRNSYHNFKNTYPQPIQSTTKNIFQGNINILSQECKMHILDVHYIV